MLLEQIEAKQREKQVEHLQAEVSAKQTTIDELSARVEKLEASLKKVRKGASAMPTAPVEDAISFASETPEGAKVVGVKIAPDLRARIDRFKEEHKISSARHAVLALLFLATRTLAPDVPTTTQETLTDAQDPTP